MRTPPLLHRAQKIAEALTDVIAGAAGDALLVDGGEGASAREAARAKQLGERLEGLGPVFIKLGQLLSTRPDLLSPVYMDALQRLQSRVLPMSAEDVRLSVGEHERALGRSPFERFDEAPLAAASLAQVHRARLRDGTEVAVKLRRRGVVGVVELDLQILALVASVVQRLLPDAEVYDLPATVEELGQALREELDLRNEAESLVVFGRHLAEWAPQLSVPKVYEEISTESVMVMELIRGKPLDAGAASSLSPEAKRSLSRALAHAYFKMFFIDGVFHADPHPGNVFVTDDGRLVLLDFGMIGRIERQVSDNLVRVLLNFQLKDSHGVAHAFLDIGKPSARSDENGWIMDVRRLLPRYHGKRLERLNLGTLLIDLLRCAARNGIQAPPITALVCKSLANMDGSARIIDPGIDVVSVFREFLPRLLEAHVGRVASPEQAAKVALDLSIGATRVPFQVATILEKAATGRLRVIVDPLGGEAWASKLGSVGLRVAIGQVVAAWLLRRARP